MKKQLIIFILAIVSVVFAATIKQEVNTYYDHSYKSEPAGNIPAGDYAQLESWGNYVKVALPNGVVGYLWNNAAVLDGSKVIGQGGSLVKGPSMKSGIITNVMPGVIVKILSTNIEWYRVEFDGIKRWVPAVRFSK